MGCIFLNIRIEKIPIINGRKNLIKTLLDRTILSQ